MDLVCRKAKGISQNCLLWQEWRYFYQVYFFPQLFVRHLFMLVTWFWKKYCYLYRFWFDLTSFQDTNLFVVFFLINPQAPNNFCSRHSNFCFSFQRKTAWHFMWIVWRRFTWNVKLYFLWKKIKIYIRMSSAAVVIGNLWVQNLLFHTLFNLADVATKADIIALNW